ncbi:hypothetical protein [Halorientalis marina]|uniref:hypothetical protein n=1 Tax=Halorientalis marina TaxID=2931976 RepID=UPI001FF1FD1F|nr:hypothetical protein [Halorientalis marina]
MPDEPLFPDYLTVDYTTDKGGNPSTTRRYPLRTHPPELGRRDFRGDTFRFSSDTSKGNNLLKTVALNVATLAGGYEVVFSGVCWDEQDARPDETFFSPRHDSKKYPPPDRVHSILPFDERAVWDAMWGFVVLDTIAGFSTGFVPGIERTCPTA